MKKSMDSKRQRRGAPQASDSSVPTKFDLDAAWMANGKRYANRCAKISAAGPPPVDWYGRWRDHTIFHLHKSLDLQEIVSLHGWGLLMGGILTGGTCFYIERWIATIMTYYLPTMVLYVLALIMSIFIQTDLTPATGADNWGDRIIWTATFIAMNDARRYLPESFLSSHKSFSTFNIIKFVSAIWNIDKGDYRNKMLSWECNKDRTKLNDDKVNETMLDFEKYHWQITVGFGTLMAMRADSLGTFYWATLETFFLGLFLWNLMSPLRGFFRS